MESTSVQRSFCTTREAAQMLGISLRTAQLWVEAGILEAWKTGGGHRRISRTSIARLLAKSPVAAEETGPSMASALPESPFCILVAEDNEDQRKLYQLRLRHWPIKPRLIIANDGFEALMKLGSEKPDLLIADLIMPNVDGFLMLQSIRSLRDFDDMAIVVVTGISKADIAGRGRLPDGIPVFPKPIPFDDLQRLVTGLASRKRPKFPASNPQNLPAGSAP